MITSKSSSVFYSLLKMLSAKDVWSLYRSNLLSSESWGLIIKQSDFFPLFDFDPEEVVSWIYSVICFWAKRSPWWNYDKFLSKTWENPCLVSFMCEESNFVFRFKESFFTWPTAILVDLPTIGCIRFIDSTNSSPFLGNEKSANATCCYLKKSIPSGDIISMF